MRILLSTIGSRGDVQPLLALGVELRKLGHEARLCVPPNFKEWIESFGVECVPIGPDVRKFSVGSASAPSKPFKLTKEQRQQLAVGTVREQFRVLPDAARGCDMIVGATALQIAAPSVAEAHGLPYVYVSYAAVTLPSPDHPPPKFGTPYPMWLPGVANRLLWTRDARSVNGRFRATLNEERARLGLPPVDSVQRYVITERPWLAADPELGPTPATRGLQVVQTGAWLLGDPAPLPDDLERFLASGEPPIYFGFGSMRGQEETGRAMIEAARALGRRAIVSRGWANLDSSGGADCIAIGDVNHEKLFPRVAAIVHHGGAGTTTAAARAGRPQVIVPHNYDQYYWSRRMRTLGVGVRGPALERLTASGLAAALRAIVRPETMSRAQELAKRVQTNGAQAAARRIIDLVTHAEKHRLASVSHKEAVSIDATPR